MIRVISRSSNVRQIWRMQSQIPLPTYAESLPPEHPVRIYLEENLFLKNLLARFARIDFKADHQLAYNLFNQLATVDIRYTRKENQLFPSLEKRGWYGPSQGMWQFHDGNRKLLKEFRARLERKDLSGIEEDRTRLIDELMRMTMVEEGRLFPTALDLLQPEDWLAMAAGEAEIGWMHRKADEALAPEVGQTKAVAPGLLKMNEGVMSLEQINLLLTVMPFDLTYVDENDRVIFYNRGDERVFPRSAGVIGREVRFCHPPKSVGTVLEILEEFRAGRKDVAEFWIGFKGRTIHIRYFAVRDGKKNYKGVIEVSQDITDIRKIEGEKRLLSWVHEPSRGKD